MASFADLTTKFGVGFAVGYRYNDDLRFEVGGCLPLDFSSLRSLKPYPETSKEQVFDTIKSNEENKKKLEELARKFPLEKPTNYINQRPEIKSPLDTLNPLRIAENKFCMDDSYLIDRRGYKNYHQSSVIYLMKTLGLFVENIETILENEKQLIPLHNQLIATQQKEREKKSITNFVNIRLLYNLYNDDENDDESFSIYCGCGMGVARDIDKSFISTVQGILGFIKPIDEKYSFAFEYSYEQPLSRELYGNNKISLFLLYNI